MKKILLTQDKFAIVDDEDFEYLSQLKWQALKHREKYYAVRINYNNGKRIAQRMHRAILNPSKDKQIDHINGDGLDNRRNNLRICNNSQNQMNSKKRVDNISGYKGVYLKKDKRRCFSKWVSRIGINNKRIHLGCFKTKEDAAIAYNRAAQKYFGEFAQLNNITAGRTPAAGENV